MNEPRQRPIPVTRQERAILEQQKKRYESRTGTVVMGRISGDSGPVGLAAAGVYALVTATRRSSQSVDVICSGCSMDFVMAVPAGTGRAVHTTCPHCGLELVVNLGTSP